MVNFSNFSLPAMLSNIPPYPLAFTPQSANTLHPLDLAFQNFQRAQAPFVGDNLYLTDEGLKALTLGLRKNSEQVDERLARIQQQLQEIQHQISQPTPPASKLNVTV